VLGGRLPAGDRHRTIKLKCRQAELEARRLVAVEVRVVATEQQTFQSVGFPQDLARHLLAFALQILNQPIDRTDHTAVEHLVVARAVCLLSYHRSEGPELVHRIPPPAPGERLFESAVLLDYQCCEPVFFRARHFLLPPKCKRRRRRAPVARNAPNFFAR